jgi:hypothetical protein
MCLCCTLAGTRKIFTQYRILLKAGTLNWDFTVPTELTNSCEIQICCISATSYAMKLGK